MKLYLHKHDTLSEYFVSSSRERYANVEGAIYFCRHRRRLAYIPDWFASKEDAISAAEKMGYSVEDMAGKA